MATNLIRHLPKSYRQSPLSIKPQQTRNSSSAQTPGPTPATNQPVRPPPLETQQPQLVAQTQVKNSNISLLIGLSLGASISALALHPRISRFFDSPEPPKQEKVVPTIDPKLMEHVILQDRKVNQLESQLSSLRDELRERDQHQQLQSNQSSSVARHNATDGSLFELSEVIQANNMASEARHSREMEEQRKLMVREHLLKVEGEILKVENKYRPTINKIRELEAHLENQRKIQQKEAPARLLWLSCQSLISKLRESPQQPLEKDPAYQVLKNFATNDNQLAMSIIDSIPPKVLREGVQSEETLSERFHRLEKICKRVALVDSQGAGLGTYLISYLQSWFIIEGSKQIPDEEIYGQQLVNPADWTTFDILARVRHCLGRRNLEQAVRYANQLRGQARVAARDWIRDARLHLLTRQALSALSTHAEAIALDTTTNNTTSNSNNSCQNNSSNVAQ